MQLGPLAFFELFSPRGMDRKQRMAIRRGLRKSKTLDALGHFRRKLFCNALDLFFYLVKAVHIKAGHHQDHENSSAGK